MTPKHYPILITILILITMRKKIYFYSGRIGWPPL